MAKFIRYNNRENTLTGPNVFDVSRAGLLGNPFTHIKDKKTKAMYVVNTRDEAIDLYDKYFDAMYKKNPLFKEAVDKIFEAAKTYGVVYIGCYCRENERCHGDIIIGKINNMLLLDALNEIKNNTKK